MRYQDWRLSEEFWAEFVERYWEKKPTVIPRPFAREILTEAEALGVLRRAAVSGEATAAEQDFFYIDGIAQKEMAPDVLPGADETSVAEFAERLSTEHGLRNYQFTLYGLQRFEPEVFFRARAAFSGLFDRVGLPAHNFNTDIFFGEYLVTAAGLHKDNAAVFSYVVHGAKKMLVWPFEYFAAEADSPDARRETTRLRHVDYTRHLDAATELTGAPGDVLYWPSTYWHVAIGDGHPHMTFNMSPYFPIRASAWADQVIAPMLRGAFGEADWVSFLPYERGNLQELAQELPARIERTLATYQSVLGSQRLRSRLMVAWLGALTGFGVNALPPPDPSAEVRGGERYAGDPEHPAVHVALSDAQELVAANGYPFLAQRGPVLDHLLAAANSGEPFSLASVVERIMGDPAAAGLREEAARGQAASYLHKLLAARAVRPLAREGTD